MDEREIDRLYGLPLEEFTAERNALAKRLRGEGERDAAAEVAKLPKPSVPAWLANRLARTDEVQVRSLLREGERLREAQRRVLDGGDPGALRDAQQKEREVVARLTAQARKLLPSASPSALERLAETLRAAAVGDDETRDLLKRGRLTKELELAGFGALAGMPVTERKRAAPARSTAKEREARARRVAEARERVKAARAAAREADREAKRAEAEAGRLRAAADDAAAEVARAEQELAALD